MFLSYPSSKKQRTLQSYKFPVVQPVDLTYSGYPATLCARRFLLCVVFFVDKVNHGGRLCEAGRRSLLCLKFIFEVFEKGKLRDMCTVVNE